MQIIGTHTTTYLLLSGIVPPRNLKLSKWIELQPGECSQLDFSTALSLCRSPDDIPVLVAFIPRITAQLKVSTETIEQTTKIAWNSAWDAILLSAFFQTEISFSLQSDVSASEIDSSSTVLAINYQMRGLMNTSPYVLNEDEAEWLSGNFYKAQKLLDNDRYQTAIHCLATYRWHTMPRVQMAILWAGIEAIFGASSEIRFRISLYIARFLYPDDVKGQTQMFAAVKKLYNTRSAAVHGSKIKGNVSKAIEDSADILCKLLIQCTNINSMPIESELVP